MTIPERVKELLSSTSWRLNNLYYIIDKKGSKILFSMNDAQREMFENVHFKNIILKARQIGSSTFWTLFLLDKCLFNHNISCGIIAHTREDAEQMFKRVKFAYENLPLSIKSNIRANTDRASELSFSNGSSIRVGTSLRSATFQYLLISEFGKICAKYPDKAIEIVTGSLNTVGPSQYVIIESTAEGREGYFYEGCKKAENAQKLGTPLTQLDYRFFFFPWHKEPSYRIGNAVSFSNEELNYFSFLHAQGCNLDNEQKSWYVKTKEIQGDKMMREYPSIPDEAWESVINGAYYSTQMSQARVEKRICAVPYDTSCLVHTAWDLGYNDCTAIWFFQTVGKEIHVIDYEEGSGESLSFWLNVVLKKPYIYGKHIAPHDIQAHEYTTGMTRQAAAAKLGVRFIPCKKTDINIGIDEVRAILPKCFFDSVKCSRGIKALDNYTKKWNERTGTWASEPLHNQYSHGADAFRSLACGLSFVVPQRKEEGMPLGKNTFDATFFPARW